MKVADTITYCTNYHKINSRPNTLANYKFLLRKFGPCFKNRDLDDNTTPWFRSHNETLENEVQHIIRNAFERPAQFLARR